MLFNAQATWQIDKQTRLRFDVFNLFDRRDNDITYFYTSRLPGEPAAGINDYHFHPVESRSFRIALLLNF
jgi:outer membrane receptor protein involved in Fe transport